MAIKKISEFVSGTPSSDSKILFEQNDKGKSCTIGDAVNTCSLSYEEIMAATDLTNKVPSASALKEVTTLNLLWENASPTSGFKSQGISFPNAKYKFLYFEFRQTAGGIARHFFYLMQHANLSAVMSTISYEDLKIFIRGMTVSDNNHVSFSDAYKSDTYGTYTTDNTILIPYRIYGVK